MRFTPTPEQQQLADMVQRFLADNYGIEARCKILDSREGWSREIWSKLAELGLLSLQVPEAQGGMAPAVVETLLTATATGKAMLLEPWVSSAVIATVLVRELGSAEQRAEMLPALAAGECIAVAAHFEPGARYDLQRVATSARRSGGGWTLEGRKSVVLHAPAAGGGGGGAGPWVGGRQAGGRGGGVPGASASATERAQAARATVGDGIV